MNPAKGNRLVLVIGSQCDALGKLDFLPAAAQDLYAVFTDPNLGQCLPALPDRGLLIDPTVSETRTALVVAFQRAVEAEATLILAYVGHGEFAGQRFYLFPKNATRPPGTDTAVNLVDTIAELYQNQPGRAVDGLVVLIDACYSGFAAVGAAKEWNSIPRNPRFEVLTATNDRAAYDGCFTRTITACIRKGIPGEPNGYLRCEHVRLVVRDACQEQEPCHPTNNADEGLYLSRNVAHSRFAWAGTRDAEQITRLTAAFQPTPILDSIVAASDKHRNVALIGLAGAGKSTIAAALMRPEITCSVVPDGFAHAYAFLGRQLSGDLAKSLADQLDRTVPGFKAERELFQRFLTDETRRKLDPLHREVVHPLRSVRPPSGSVFRIVVDALEQMPTSDEETIRAALGDLAGDPDLSHVHLITTARPDIVLVGSPMAVKADRVDDKLIIDYLGRRAVPPDLHAALSQRAAGNWLIARLLADLALTTPAQSADAFPTDLGAIYEENLVRAGAASTDRWRRELRPILSVLAVAGVGPILPLRLLCHASAGLGGPDREYRVRDILVDLRGLVIRSVPGTNDEHVGLFHSTLAEYLLSASNLRFSLDPVEAHGALAAALDKLAPIVPKIPVTPLELSSARDPIHHYATIREPEHLWVVGAHKRLLDSLEFRRSVIPAENLERWLNWSRRLEDLLNDDGPQRLRIRENIAHCTGESGDARNAVKLYEGLLPDLATSLGPTDPKVIATINKMASWSGKSGNAQGALSLYRSLRFMFEQLLEPDDLDMLRVRGDIALWTGLAGDPREAVRLFGDLLRDQEQIQGPDHRDTFRTRLAIGKWNGSAGHAREAVRLLGDLLRDQEQHLGHGDLDTLETRENIAHWTGESGEVDVAAKLFHKLHIDRETVLGSDHPDTLRTHGLILFWTRPIDDALKKAGQYEELLRHQERVIGRFHPFTLRSREDVAHCISRAHHFPEAEKLYIELLRDRNAILGPDHNATLRTRALLARCIGQSGKPEKAVILYRELLRDQLSLIGPRHLNTLRTRSDIAEWTGRSGYTTHADQNYVNLLRDCNRFIAQTHPYTFDVRTHFAISKFKSGKKRESVKLLRKLIEDLVNALGNDHPTTRNARKLLAKFQNG